MFDPFCRHKKILFNGLNTTVGQLNFFEWAIQDEVLDYLVENLESAQKDMDECSTTLQETSSADKKKRHELSRSATKSICRHDVRVSVSFT